MLEQAMLHEPSACNAACNVPCSDHALGAATAAFAPRLERIMLGAGLWDASLARRLGVARSEVFRWRTGRVLPAARNRTRLAEVLRAAVRASGHELLPDERALIDQLAAESADHLADARNRVELPDRCAVYAYQCAPRSFPSQCSRRTDELERLIGAASRACCSASRPSCGRRR
jgi:transcriptional regulator with XRE-family HTH domain